MKKLFSVGVLLVPVLGLCVSSATTYNLLYDGLFATDVESLERDSHSNDDGNCRVSQIAAATSLAIANDVLQAYIDTVESIEGKELIQDADRRCYEISDESWCTIDHVVKDDATIHVVTHISKGAAAQIDASLTASDPALVRETLVQSVSKINEQLRLSDGESAWSIRHRPSVMEMKRAWTDLRRVAATQERRDVQAGSIENIILGNAEVRNRTRLDHAFVQSKNSSSRTSIELWQYDDFDLKEPVKAFFIEGQLQTTTAPAGAAHAEALVHPALLAHPDPKSVAVVSLTPNAIVKEVLKYKSIVKVSVVGADKTALDMVQRNMPSQHDCSFLADKDSNCMQHSVVEIVDHDFQDWVSSCLHNSQQEKGSCRYDAIFVDVPIGSTEWLSPDPYGDFGQLCETSDTILVISSGSRPPVFDVEISATTEMSARDSFIRQASRGEDHGGLDFNTILLYDEVRECHP